MSWPHTLLLLIGVALSLANSSAQTGPGPISVSPSSGNQSPQVFTFAFAAGSKPLYVVDILINDVLDGRQACYIAYVTQGPYQGMYLVKDNGSDLIGIPTNGSASNGQCTVTPTAISNTGASLSLTVRVSFTSSFAGNKVVYLSSADTSGATTDWVTGGVWTVLTPLEPAGAPNPLSVLPTSAGVTGITAAVADARGASDIYVVDLLINSASTVDSLAILFTSTPRPRVGFSSRITATPPRQSTRQPTRPPARAIASAP